MESYRAGGALKWKSATEPQKDEFGRRQPGFMERWVTIRTANVHEVLVSSVDEFDELVPDARPEDRERVFELFEDTDGRQLYLTIYPAD